MLRAGLNLVRAATNAKTGANYKLYDSGTKGPYQFRMVKEQDNRHDTYTASDPSKFHQTMDSIEKGGNQVQWQDKKHAHQVVTEDGTQYLREAQSDSWQGDQPTGPVVVDKK